MVFKHELEISLRSMSTVRMTTELLPPLSPSSIRLQIIKFGLTANNITYVALSKSYQYGDFFPTSIPESTTGMPVWGLAKIVESKNEKFNVGELIYGYYPAADVVDLKPGKIVPTHFEVFRPQLPADRQVYNQYMRCSHDPMYNPKTEDAMILFRPLFATSHYLCDFLQVNNFYNADLILISSASSKTSFCLAQLITQSKTYNPQKGPKVVAITSKSSKPFVEKLKVYTDIITYDTVEESLTSLKQGNKTAVYIDVSGNSNLSKSIMNVFPPHSSLKTGISVGMSHLDKVENSKNLNAGSKVFQTFFAPEWAKKRIPELGTAENMRRMLEGWNLLMGKVDEWIRIQRVGGSCINASGEGLVNAYLRFLAGKVDADEGVVISISGGSTTPGASKL
ncbi:hypothetical protein HDU76_004055 [Blyttiomyces sp. JEL0837]|nr:hypothetical protein HDU76_004055 [Blyttiomyces sp. JEL0837]